MKNLTLENIAKACSGTYRGPQEKKKEEVSSVFTDSRKAAAGGLFVAIKGARTDAHDFIDSVMKAGALAALSEKDLGEQEYPYIQVTSTLQAVKDIAEFYLKQLQIPVVGITGSVGKTSTKEMIAAVLSQKYKVLKTQGNFNNELGLPLTVFNLRDDDEIAVLEMGISDFGEMHRLAKIARPDTCVITNIGLCHLEFLKSRDGILKAKTEIFDFLEKDGHVILNGDDDKLVTVREVKGIAPKKALFCFHKNKRHFCLWGQRVVEEAELPGIQKEIRHLDAGQTDLLAEWLRSDPEITVLYTVVNWYFRQPFLLEAVEKSGRRDLVIVLENNIYSIALKQQHPELDIRIIASRMDKIQKTGANAAKAIVQYLETTQQERKQ